MTDTGHHEAGNHPSDFFGPLERSGVARGLLLVVVAVVIGALLMPSATRPPLVQAATAASTGATTPTTAPGIKVPSSQAPTTTASPLASVKVLVANGTNTNGAAAAVSSFLSGKGFGTLTPVDALTTVPASEVYPVGGDNAAVQEVLSALGLGASAVQSGATPVPVASTAGANVVVIVGPDLLSKT